MIAHYFFATEKTDNNFWRISYVTRCSLLAVVYISQGPTVEVSDIISFLVVPSENKRDKYVSSQVIKDTLCRVLKPADCGLKVRRISYARDNGVRIEAISSDIEKIKAHSGLLKAGLRGNMKLNPRLIIYGIPAEIDVVANDVKVLYIFSPKQDMHITSCILEVIPAVRRTLLGCEQIYLRYSACSFSDHVRIMQCYRCLSFGHIAKDCKGKLSYRHCVGAHGMKDCSNKDQSPKYLNYKRHHVSHSDLAHSTMNAAKCSVLGIEDKIDNTSYE
ncbi:hypothetical protein ACFW04_011790 [Cataglyphis niger]